MKNFMFAFFMGTIFFFNDCHVGETANRTSASLINESQLITNIEQVASSSVPIGTVIAWPYATLPSDGNWLECNGQYVNASIYPDYVARFGTTTPDYRGLFLRGRGGKAAALNTLQAEAVNVPKTAGNMLRIDGVSKGEYYTDKLGQYNMGNVHFRTGSSNTAIGPGDGLDLPIEFESPAVETRPANKSVVYIIRVK